MSLLQMAESDGLEALADLDLSFTQARIVAILACCDDAQPIHSLAQRLGLSDAATGRNVERLLQLELVQRRESPSDRRVKLVSLAPAGAALADAHFDAKRASIRALTRSLPQPLRDRLHRVLTDVIDSGHLGPHPSQESCV